MELLKKRKGRKTIIYYPVCRYKDNVDEIHLLYNLYEFLSKKEENTLEEIQEYTQELFNIELVLPYFEKEKIHNGMVYAPYPINEVIKNILSNYEIL